MYSTVSVDEAIKRGKRKIIYPPTVITIIVIGGAIILNSNDLVAKWIIYASAICCTLFSIIYRSFTITKWRLWAFENVQNVHDLMTKATEEKLLWPEESFITKIEVWTNVDRQKWNTIQKKFDKSDIFDEDYLVPEDFKVYLAPATTIIAYVFGLFFICIGVFGIVQKSYVVSLAFIIAGVGIFYRSYKKASDKSPRLILNSNGIETANDGFWEWKVIANEQVTTETEGRAVYEYLTFEFPYGIVKFSISDLDIKKKDLENLLHTYRLRYEKSLAHK